MSSGFPGLGWDERQICPLRGPRDYIMAVGKAAAVSVTNQPEGCVNNSSNAISSSLACVFWDTASGKSSHAKVQPRLLAFLHASGERRSCFAFDLYLRLRLYERYFRGNRPRSTRLAWQSLSF